MIALIDYDAGNTCSVSNALDRLDADFILTDDKDQLSNADKVIFPGVGHAGAAMESLKKKNLIEVIKSLRQPVLGICVGMQLLGHKSEEGDTICLGIVDTTVRRFEKSPSIKVPHMGWNQMTITAEDTLFDQLDKEDYFYFVHSYYMPVCESTIASSRHDVVFSAVVRQDNFRGVQFHAEKSGDVGTKLLSNFLNNVI